MKSQSKFGHNIYQYKEPMLNDLKTLIAIPSICSDEISGRPFGTACADALDCVLRQARNLNLSTDNVDYYAGAASYGSGESCIDIMTHIDVVPPGDGWSTEPYILTLKNGYLYGRGIADDKGAAIAALYCLKALKDGGVQSKYKVRVLFGCGEEIGSNDLDIYYAARGYPVMGFTPDCHYGVCAGEKGIVRADISASVRPSCVIEHFRAGNAVNAVPSQAKAVLTGSEFQYQALTKKAAGKPEYTVAKENHHIYVTAAGAAAHGAEPELGENAAARLICLLGSVFSPEEMGPLFSFVYEKIGMEYDGSTLGIRTSDFPSGALSLNLGIVNANSQCAALSLDIRYPVTADKEMIMNTLKKSCLSFGISLQEANHMPPLYSSSDSLLVRTLCDSYESVTQTKCSIYSTGGGTYARHSGGSALAFGPVFETDPPSNAHGPDEMLSLDSFMRHAEICLEALFRLLTS